MARPRNLLLGLVVLACAASLWYARGTPGLAWLTGDRDVPSAAEAEPAAVTRPVHLRVFNATDVSGLAADVAVQLPRLGCVVEGVGNAPGWPGSPTLLVNRRLKPAEARRLAGLLGEIPVIKEWDGRTSEDAVLVLGEDHDRVRRALDTEGR